MASIYSCAKCGANLNLKTGEPYPADIHFQADNRGKLSFPEIDFNEIRFVDEIKYRPLLETLKHWGMQRARIKINCRGCGRLLGHVYEDGPLITDCLGHFGTEISRTSRYRFKIQGS